MCGIAGFRRTNPTDHESDALLQRMNDALSHRGPDDSGIYRREGVGFAHRRLSVIDVGGGRQPMASEDGETVIVLNGEIYNHVALREELERRGRRFRTRSDTEVVLQLYEEEGERSIARLRGMFAFAVWDRRERKLWLARDRVGQKPLYWYHDGDLFLFGSELKAIAQHPAVPRAVDERGIGDFLEFGYVPAPRTAMRGVRKLSAGHALSVTDRGVVDTAYWDLDFTPRAQRSEGATAEELGAAIRDSVIGHLVSDVPVGALLSGGLDSTAVLGIMAESMGGGIPAFTANFTDHDEEDPRYAAIAARAYRAAGEEVPIAPPTPALLDRLAWHYDEPFADPSAIPTFLLCEGARRRVPVVLSGDGGDENFGGYRRYRTNATLAAIRRFAPGPLGAGMLRAAARIAPDGKWLPKPLRVRRWLRDAAEDPARIYWNEMSRCHGEAKRALFAPSFRRALDGYDPFSIVEGHLAVANDLEPKSRLLYLDFKTYLADGILTKVDRASMAHGLEVRVPLLDHLLVEFVAGIPYDMKVAGGGGKRIMKRALRRFVPREIVDRKKRGFSPPLDRWFRGDLGAIFAERVLKGDPFVSNYLEMGEVRALWEKHRSGAANRSLLLWSILALENWGRSFL